MKAPADRSVRDAGSVRAQGGIVFPQKTLEEEPGDKPAGGEIEADYPGQVPAAALVVPRAQFAPVQKHAREKFPGKNQPHVCQAAEKHGTVPKQAADGGEKRCQSVDGKHPDGSCAGQFTVAPAEGVEGREGDFQKPPKQAAVTEVVQKFSHADSVAGFRHIYTRLGLIAGG